MGRGGGQDVERVIDLTRTLFPGFPTTIPDVPAVERWTATTYDSHGYSAWGWSMVEHIGTHVDAPLHFFAKGRNVTALRADELVVQARVLDFVDQARATSSRTVTIADLEAEERRMGRIPDGSAVLLCSGWSDRSIDAGGYLGWDGTAHRSPGWSAEAVEWLLAERGIVALGTDTSSIDAGDTDDAFAHKALLGADRYAVEGLINLEGLIDHSSFRLVVGVIPWESGTGGPCRALALVGAAAGGAA